MNGRSLLLRLLMAGLSVLVVVALGEVALRLAGHNSGFVDSALDVRPTSVLHSPDFRDRNEPGGKASGGFRVLVLGDSFAWGAGVHAADAYPLRLERRLSRLRPDLAIEVVNWSRTGWNTAQAWRSVRPRLTSLRPDVVILGFTLNDPEPSLMDERELLVQPLHRRAPGGALSRALHAHSSFFRLFWDRFENRRQRRAFMSYYDDLFRGASWRQCRAAMGELRAATGKIEVPLLLVIFPVFDSQLDDSYSYRRLHNKIASAARDLDIPVLDLLADYRGIDGRRLALTPFTDPHPSELAHRIAADRITDHLVSEGLVPLSAAGDSAGRGR